MLPLDIPSGFIYIPLDVRGRSLFDYPMSVRLRGILERMRFRLLGDLHGRSFEEFAKYRNCGAKTIWELAGIITGAQHGATDVAPPPIEGAAAGTISISDFRVPERVRELPFEELPISKRLGQLINAMRLKKLGDLHERTPSELMAYRNCGRKTLTEVRELIARASTGEFDAVPFDEITAPVELVRLVEQGLAKLLPNDRALLLDRLGGRGQPPKTLEQLGQQRGVTRERIRQIVEKTILRLRTGFGPRIPKLLDVVEQRCVSSTCPLTPALLTKWISDTAASLSLSAITHVRLIAALREEIPCWPEEHDGIGATDEKTNEFGALLASIVMQSGARISVAEAFLRLRQERGYRRMEAAEYLARLRRVRRLIVEFPESDSPIIRLRRMSASHLAAQILAESDTPLTADEIHSRAITRFGAEMVLCESRAIGNALSGNVGVYLVGSGLYGLQEHFHVPTAEWKQVRNEFARLLAKLNRPLSAYEVVNDRLMPWIPAGTRAHEIAAIARGDNRFTDLGFLLFALAKWGVEERQLLRDLIPQVLRKANRLLTADELGTELRRLRSVSPLTILNSTAKIPGVRSFGHGYFGLSSWREDKLSRLVNDPAAAENAVLRAELPLTFAALCDQFGINVASPLANKLWATVASVEAIVKNPTDRLPSTRLIHRSCRIERAVAGALRRMGRPAAAFEVQWELTDLFGPLYRDWSVADIERLLRRTAVFSQTAEGNFSLDLRVDELDVDVDAIRGACIALLSHSGELLGCEELIDRLQATGQDVSELTTDVLAIILRDTAELEELGRNRFRYRR